MIYFITVLFLLFVEIVTRAQNDVSCSAQLNLTNGDACVIYNTSVCRSEEFYINKFMVSQSPKLLYQESKAPFEVMVEPYLSHDRNNRNLSAINITLKIIKKEVTGFYLFLHQASLSKPVNICRIFYFSKAVRMLPDSNIKLFFDGFWDLGYSVNYEYDLIIRTIPMKEELRYAMKVSKDPYNCSNWDAVIMINSLALRSQTIEFKFSKAPSYCNVQLYLVFLKKGNHTSQPMNISASLSGGAMLGGVINRNVMNLSGGRYQFSVAAYTNETKRLFSDRNEMKITIVGASDSTTKTSLLYWISALLIVFIMGIVYTIYRLKSVQKGVEFVKPRILLLYSYDCELHMEVVLKFASYLQTYCNIEVLLDEFHMNDNESVVIWLSKLPDVNYYVIIMSRGVYHKIEMKNVPPIEEGSMWGDRFTPTYNTMLMRLAAKNITDKDNEFFGITKVFFDYTCRHKIPKSLQTLGPSYDLVTQLNNFIYQIHHRSFRSSLMQLCNPKMPGSDLLSNPMGVDLNEAINAMSAFQKSNLLWFDKVISPADTRDNLNVSSEDEVLLQDSVIFSKDDGKFKNESSASLMSYDSYRNLASSFVGKMQQRCHYMWKWSKNKIKK